MREASFLYFAYGSNMLTERLCARCPSARPLGAAVARGYALEFIKRSVDGSAKATLVRAGDDAALVPGVLFEVARADLARLDAAEGVGFGYDRDDAFAVARAANDVEAVVSTYIAPAHACDRSLVAYDWYLALVLAGARLHGLPPAHIEALGRVAVRPDPDDRRPTRREALELLRRAGLRRADPRLTPGRRGFDPSLANRSVTSRRPDATLNAGSRTRAAT